MADGLRGRRSTHHPDLATTGGPPSPVDFLRHTPKRDGRTTVIQLERCCGCCGTRATTSTSSPFVSQWARARACSRSFLTRFPCLLPRVLRGVPRGALLIACGPAFLLGLLRGRRRARRAPRRRRRWSRRRPRAPPPRRPRWSRRPRRPGSAAARARVGARPRARPPRRRRWYEAPTAAPRGAGSPASDEDDLTARLGTLAAADPPAAQKGSPRGVDSLPKGYRTRLCKHWLASGGTAR